MREGATIAAMALMVASTPALAEPSTASSPLDRLAALIRSSAPTGERRLGTARWQLPAIEAAYDRPEPPRLRIRGKKVKLRVPFG